MFWAVQQGTSGLFLRVGRWMSVLEDERVNIRVFNEGRLTCNSKEYQVISEEVNMEWEKFCLILSHFMAIQPEKMKMYLYFFLRLMNIFILVVLQAGLGV